MDVTAKQRSYTKCINTSQDGEVAMAKQKTKNKNPQKTKLKTMKKIKNMQLAAENNTKKYNIKQPILFNDWEMFHMEQKALGKVPTKDDQSTTDDKGSISFELPKKKMSYKQFKKQKSWETITKHMSRLERR